MNGNFLSFPFFSFLGQFMDCSQEKVLFWRIYFAKKKHTHKILYKRFYLKIRRTCVRLIIFYQIWSIVGSTFSIVVRYNKYYYISPTFSIGA